MKEERYKVKMMELITNTEAYKKKFDFFCVDCKKWYSIVYYEKNKGKCSCGGKIEKSEGSENYGRIGQIVLAREDSDTLTFYRLRSGKLRVKKDFDITTYANAMTMLNRQKKISSDVPDCIIEELKLKATAEAL